MANLDLTTEQSAVIQGHKPNRKLWLWTCGGCAFLLCVVFGIIAVVLFFSSDESYPLNGEVVFPATVQQGDDFDFVITLTNPTTDPVFIKHIVLHQDLSAPYLLAGASVISVEPSMEAEPFASGNDVQYSYFREIQPGETLTVTFYLRAESTGIYYANVGVYAKDPVLPDPAFMHVFHFIDAKIEITP